MDWWQPFLPIWYTQWLWNPLILKRLNLPSFRQNASSSILIIPARFPNPPPDSFLRSSSTTYCQGRQYFYVLLLSMQSKLPAQLPAPGDHQPRAFFSINKTKQEITALQTGEDVSGNDENQKMNISSSIHNLAIPIKHSFDSFFTESLCK